MTCEYAGRWRYTGLYGCPGAEEEGSHGSRLKNLAMRADLNEMMVIGKTCRGRGRSHPRSLLEGFNDMGN